MARLAVAAVLLTLVVVALCHFIDGEAVAASPNYANEPEPELAGPESNDAYNYNGVYSSAAVPADLDRSAGEEVPVVQSYDVPKAASPNMAVSPADGVDQGFLRLPSHMRQPCRHGDRHMWWARRHGLHRQDVYGFQGQEKKLVSEVPVEPATYGYGGETREWVALPVAEPDPDSRQDAAVALEEVRKPAFHGEQGDEDEMARAWRSGSASTTTTARRRRR
ncbi:hypothetical protein E2562_013109 [Oryza meyeriana var. granulata]|uniref:Uncharacterized protein n=1 Tax=Oryza meyeriana var. granulata TaxID=110450 RepID=A0A6G1F7U7_9ORYZ|nr:hypothetical protein E2562_013109 [Oryza meyeriana var. granulata]